MYSYGYATGHFRRATAWMLLLAWWCAVGCGARLPPGRAETRQAPNCREVRTASVVAVVVRPLSESISEGTERAVQQAMVQLVKQSTGSEVAQLTRSVSTLNETRYEHEFQIADYEKTKGRILDYRITDISDVSERAGHRFRVDIQGRVCADALVPEPLVVAIGETGRLSTTGRAALIASLSRSLSVQPAMELADQPARATYHDIAIGADADGPRTTMVDRRKEIAAIRAAVGASAVVGAAPVAKRVTLTVTITARFHEHQTRFVETRDVEREVDDYVAIDEALVADLEAEGVQRAADGIVVALSRYLKRSTQ